MKRIPRIYISEDQYGCITLSSDLDNKTVFIQDEANKQFIIGLLRKGERKDLENGYKIELKENEPRASCLSDFDWQLQERS